MESDESGQAFHKYVDFGISPEVEEELQRQIYGKLDLEKTARFAELYGAGRETLDILDAKRAYQEADCDWERDKIKDQWQKGILTQDEVKQMLDECEARRNELAVF